MSRILTLTMNPAVDVSTAVPRLQPGGKMRCGPERRDPGGGGLNVARVLHELGAEALAIYPAGGALGDELQLLLAREGVQSRVVPIAGETREVFNVVETESGQQYRFVLPGPHLHGAEWMACLRAVSDCSQPPAAVICASGSLPRGVPDDFYARVGQVAAGLGAKFVLDASGAALRKGLDAHPFLIKPNLAELRELSGAPLDSEAERLAACRALIRERRAHSVALTLGGEGALLVDADQAWIARPLDVHPASTVGAGDSFLASLVHALLAGESPPDALRRASAAGAAALLAPGTELCRAADVRRLEARIVVEPVAELAQAAC